MSEGTPDFEAKVPRDDDHKFHKQRPAVGERATPVWTTEDQARMDQAIRESFARLNATVPLIMEQMQKLASVALPQLAKAFEPIAKMMKEMNLTPGMLESIVKGETLAEEMAEGLSCLRCNPPRVVAPGYMKRHVNEVHGRTPQ